MANNTRKIAGGMHKTYSLDSIKSFLTDRQTRKTDIAGNIGLTRLDREGLKLSTDNGVVNLKPTVTAWKQLLELASIPTEFFIDRLSVEERISVYNREVAGKVNLDRKFRTSLNEGINLLYAAVSPKYRELDNDKVFDIVDKSEVPLVGVVGSGINFDHSKFRFVERDATIASGQFLPMVEIINSESGQGAFTMFAGVYRIACTNGLMVSVSDELKSRLIHLGNSGKSVGDFAPLWNLARHYADKHNRAQNIIVGTDEKIRIANKAKDAGLSLAEVESVIDTANEYYNGGNNLSNIISSFTQAAQQYTKATNLEKRTRMETFAGSLLKAA